MAPNGVLVIGTTNLPATMPQHASQLYSRNIHALLTPMIRDGVFAPDFEDEIAKGACIVRDGQNLRRVLMTDINALLGLPNDSCAGSVRWV